MRTSVLFIVLCIGTGAVFGQESCKTVQELLEQIRENERALVNVRVNSTYKAELWDQQNKKWSDRGGGTLTAWLPGIPGSKLRVDFHKRRTRWIDGPVPFSEDSYVIAYNGRAGQRLYTRTGSPSNPDITPRGKIAAKRPDFHTNGGIGSGWEASVFGFGDELGRRLSEIIQEMTAADQIDMSVQEVVFRDTPSIELKAMSGGNKVQTWYFDPLRNYALLGAETYTRDGIALQSFAVEEFLEPSPGIFYPSKLTKHLSLSGGAQWRWSYHASKVVANDPAFSDSIFNIEWPWGTVIHDEVSDVVFTIGDSETDLLEKIDMQVQNARNMPTTAPGEAPHESLTSPPASETTELATQPAIRELQTNSDKNNMVYVLVIAAILLFLVAILSFVLLRKGRGGANGSSG